MKFSTSALFSTILATMATSAVGSGIPPEVLESLPQDVQDMLAESPAVQITPCDQYEDNQANGICTAYYKKECDTVDFSVSCAKLEENFLAVTGVPLPMLSPCPVNFEELFGPNPDVFAAGAVYGESETDGSIRSLRAFATSGRFILVRQGDDFRLTALGSTLGPGAVTLPLEDNDTFQSCVLDLAPFARQGFDYTAANLGSTDETTVCPCFDSAEVSAVGYDSGFSSGAGVSTSSSPSLFLRSDSPNAYYGATGTYCSGPYTLVSDLEAAKCQAILFAKTFELFEDFLVNGL